MTYANRIVEFVASGEYLGASWPNYREFRDIPADQLGRAMALAMEIAEAEGWDLWADSAYNFRLASAEADLEE